MRRLHRTDLLSVGAREHYSSCTSLHLRKRIATGATHHPPAWHTSHMYDIVQKDNVIGVLTWFKQHNDYYQDIPINRNWYNMVSGDDIPNILLDNENADDISINHKYKSYMDDSNKNESCDTLEVCNIHKSYTETHHTQSTSHEICEKYVEEESSSGYDQ